MPRQSDRGLPLPHTRAPCTIYRDHNSSPAINQNRATRSMEQVEVKSLATKVGRIGFGCDPLGEHGWGASDPSAMAAAIHVALDSGINLFDVSDVYGLGRAETT